MLLPAPWVLQKELPWGEERKGQETGRMELIAFIDW